MKNQENSTKSGKKGLVIAGAGVAAVALVGAGALALFSDTSDTATGGTVGTVSVAVVNPDLSNKTNINPGDNDAQMWSSLYKDDERHYIPTSEDPLFVPGASHNEDDYSSYVTVATTPHDLTFAVANTGTKSIRTRQTFIVSCYQVATGENEKTTANFLPANVFTLYEDGTYYGTKTQDILDVYTTTDYNTSKAPATFYANEYARVDKADADASDDAGKAKAAYMKSTTDGQSQLWEELAYKYYIDEDDNEYLVAVPNIDLQHPIAESEELPKADDVQKVPFGKLIKAVKYVVYSDIFDGVTDDADSMEAEIEGAYGQKSNLGENISEIPDAYHVMTTEMCDNKYAGATTVYYKDQNGNVQYATADGKKFFYLDTKKNLFIAAQDGELGDVTVKEGEYVIGVPAAKFAVDNNMFKVELNTEMDSDGHVVFTDSLVDENGKVLDKSERIPLVHAYAAREYSYMVGMDKDSTNKYQGATVTIDVIVEAMQYRNTDGLADWKSISTNTITTALDFTDNADSHTSITVPAKEEEPMMENELTGSGNSQNSAIEGNAYNETNKVSK